MFRSGKPEVIDWKTFMGGQYKKPSALKVIVEHVERNRIIYRVAGVTVMLLLACDVSAFASSPDAVPAFAQSGGIDAKASAIYYGKFLAIGKWALIIKGGWSTVQKTISEDFEGAKKSFFQYLLVYLLLLVFPWAMKEMDGLIA